MVTFRSFSLGVLLLFLLNTLQAQSKNAQIVLDQESRRFEAMTKADTIQLGPMLADELVYVHSNALVESKKDHLSAISARKLVYEKMTREEASVRFYGKTALINGKLKVKGILNGNAFEVRLLYVTVYRKKRGMWQLVHWQSTRIP